MSALFFSQELFIAKGLETNRTTLVMAFVIAQFFAFIGSLAFERIAHLQTQRRPFSSRFLFGAQSSFMLSDFSIQ
jgi:hypothetical protein